MLSPRSRFGLPTNAPLAATSARDKNNLRPSLLSAVDCWVTRIDGLRNPRRVGSGRPGEETPNDRFRLANRRLPVFTWWESEVLTKEVWAIICRFATIKGERNPAREGNESEVCVAGQVDHVVGHLRAGVRATGASSRWEGLAAGQQGQSGE